MHRGQQTTIVNSGLGLPSPWTRSLIRSQSLSLSLPRLSLSALPVCLLHEHGSEEGAAQVVLLTVVVPVVGVGARAIHTHGVGGCDSVASEGRGGVTGGEGR